MSETPENLPDNSQEFSPAMPLSPLRDAVEEVRTAIAGVLVGQENVLDLLLVALVSDGHVLLEGPPGLAKTLAAKLLARSVDTGFGRLQFTPDLMPSDVIGTSVFDPRTTAFEFRQGPIFSNIVLVDEINRAPAKTQAALFEVMEERQATVDGVRHPMSDPFMIVATQNPIEQEGTYRLPEAQLDRFFFKIVVDYPSVDDEAEILRRAHEGQGALRAEQVKPVLSPARLAEARALVRAVKCEPKLLRYIAELIQHTRTDNALSLGASPRASLAILQGAKASAAIAGRDFIVPEDIHAVINAVLRHRVQLTPEREMEGVLVEDVIKRIIERTEIPR